MGSVSVWNKRNEVGRQDRRITILRGIINIWYCVSGSGLSTFWFPHNKRGWCAETCSYLRCILKGQSDCFHQFPNAPWAFMKFWSEIKWYFFWNVNKNFIITLSHYGICSRIMIFALTLWYLLSHYAICSCITHYTICSRANKECESI